MEDFFTIANKNFKSRLIVGTGKYKNFEETAKAVKASGADIVTVAVRRVNILNNAINKIELFINYPFGFHSPLATAGMNVSISLFGNFIVFSCSALI